MPTPNIQHIFVLMLENRSFDHMLGISGIEGSDAETNSPTAINGVTLNQAIPQGDTTCRISQASLGPMNADPGHEFPDVVEQLAGPGVQWPDSHQYPPRNGTGFASSFMRTAGNKVNADPCEITRCFTADQLPVLNALAREYAICDSWFSSMPGPTLPNRFFLLAGTSGGLDHSPSNTLMVDELTLEGFPFQHGTVFQQPLTTRIYCGGILCMAQTMKGVTFADVHRYSNFEADIKSGSYNIQFTLIEPDYGDVTGTFKGGTSQHPMDSVTGGEGLIKHVYETIRNSPLWEKSLLVVLWDEHGGFYDHVLPPAAVTPGDTPVSRSANQYGFDFSLYGLRVASVIVSPWIPRYLIDHRVYDHTSILATAETLFRFAPLTRRDAAARNLMSLMSLAEPRTTPDQLPEPAPEPAAAIAAVDKSATANTGNVPAFLSAALRTHISLSPSAEHPGILERVRSISTLAHADEYFKEVEQKIAAAHTQRAQA
jgi:phospholipase C